MIIIEKLKKKNKAKQKNEFDATRVLPHSTLVPIRGIAREGQEIYGELPQVESMSPQPPLSPCRPFILESLPRFVVPIPRIL